MACPSLSSPPHLLSRPLPPRSGAQSHAALKPGPEGRPSVGGGAGPGSTKTRTPGQLPSSPTPAWCQPSSGATKISMCPALDCSAGHGCPSCPVPGPQDNAAAKGGAALNSYSTLAAPIRRGIGAQRLPQHVPVPVIFRAGPTLSQRAALCQLPSPSLVPTPLPAGSPQGKIGSETSRGRAWASGPPPVPRLQNVPSTLSQKPRGGAIRCGSYICRLPS